MLNLLVKNRMRKLFIQYKKVKKEAIKLMSKGDIDNYLKKLKEAHQLRNQLTETKNLSL